MQTYSCHKLSWLPNEGRAGRRVGLEGGVVMSLIGNIHSFQMFDHLLIVLCAVNVSNT
jgi:hypothetical protein